MKVKSFIKFLLDHFNEDDNIEIAPAYGDCSLRKLEADEVDESFIWITYKHDKDKDNETSYHGFMIDKQYEAEDIV